MINCALIHLRLSCCGPPQIQNNSLTHAKAIDRISELTCRPTDNVAADDNDDDDGGSDDEYERHRPRVSMSMMVHV